MGGVAEHWRIPTVKITWWSGTTGQLCCLRTRDTCQGMRTNEGPDCITGCPQNFTFELRQVMEMKNGWISHHECSLRYLLSMSAVVRMEPYCRIGIPCSLNIIQDYFEEHTKFEDLSFLGPWGVVDESSDPFCIIVQIALLGWSCRQHRWYTMDQKAALLVDEYASRNPTVLRIIRLAHIPRATETRRTKQWMNILPYMATSNDGVWYSESSSHELTDFKATWRVLSKLKRKWFPSSRH